MILKIVGSGGKSQKLVDDVHSVEFIKTSAGPVARVFLDSTASPSPVDIEITGVVYVMNDKGATIDKFLPGQK